MNATGYGIFFNCLKAVYSFLCGDVSYASELTNVSSTVGQLIAGIATTLATLLIYMALAKQSAIVAEHHPETIFKFLIRSVIVYILVLHSAEFFGETMISAFNSLAKDVFTNFGIDGTKDSFEKFVGGYSLGEIVKNILSKIISLANPKDWISYLISPIYSVMLMITGLELMISAFTRFFKIYMYTCFLPIGIAYFAEPSFSQYGKNYARAYLGACLEGVTIAVAILMFLAFSKAYNNIEENFWARLLMVSKYSETTKYIFRIAILQTFKSICKNADTITNKLFGFA